MKYEKLDPIQVKEKLINKGVRFFTPEEFQRLFKISETRIKYFLENYTKNGFFLRLKNGLYALRDYPLREEEVANILYKPSYISFEYALSYYGIISEASYEVTSASTKPTRSFSVDGKTFSYFSLKKKIFTGYYLLEKGEKRFLIASPEKAFLDYLYLVSYNEKSLNDRLYTKRLEKKKIELCLPIFERPSLTKLVQKFISL